MTSNTMGEIHASHPEHKLVQKSYKKRYICDGCQEPGIGSRYRCEDCDYDLHEHCMFYKSTTRHDFFPNSTFKFLLRPPGQDKRWCNGCGKPVRGFVYHCKEEDLDLHPCCMNLPNNKKIVDFKFKLRDKVLKKCIRCKKKKLEGGASSIKGWSYVSKCDKFHCHVNCISELIPQVRENGSTGNNDYNDQTAPDSLALTLGNLERPIQGRNGGRSSGNKVVSIMKMLFEVVLGILLGDPTTIGVAVGGFIIEIGNHFSTQNKGKQHKKLTTRPENIEKTSQTHQPQRKANKTRQTEQGTRPNSTPSSSTPHQPRREANKTRQTEQGTRPNSTPSSSAPRQPQRKANKRRQTEQGTRPNSTPHQPQRETNKTRQTEQGTRPNSTPSSSTPRQPQSKQKQTNRAGHTPKQHT